MNTISKELKVLGQDTIDPAQIADWPTKRDWVAYAFDEMGKAGYFGLSIPEAYGGHELGNLAMILTTEALSGRSSGFGATSRSTSVVKPFGSAALRDASGYTSPRTRCSRIS